ncbi:hypothetical protein DRI50_11880 [candidate division KSB1 bacterium]|nr:MAG: hypothetical protein DRI50_11880 [candidate division KSB1 bacterium]
MDKNLKFMQKLSEKKLGQHNLQDVVIKLLLFFVVLLTTPLLFTSQRSFKYTDMKVGTISSRKVVAPFNFFVLKTEEELKAEQDSVKRQVPYYFVFNDSLTVKDLNLLHNLLPYL